MSKTRKYSLKLIFIVVFVLMSFGLTLSVYAQSTFDYTVKEGNSFYTLAQRFNSTVEDISAKNPKVAQDNLLVGSKLKITAGSGVKIHAVKKGDTLWRLAINYKSSVSAITEKNRIDNPELIYIGDVLAIPDINIQNEVMKVSKKAVELLRNRDFQGISQLVHPVKGIRFSPYGYVNINSDLIFSNSKVSKFASDTKKYTWGAYDGTGDPIILTPAQYFDRFVYKKDFAKTKQIGFNKVLGHGNSLINQFEVYPRSNIVEYYIPGTEYYGYMDWQSLRLVFEKFDNNWYLIGIIHDEWTI